ncbi:NAD-dependent epimerase/dehydratase family protein [candidate division KSB1 bacterium]|nr:NAD-dependent epimerase/dehydratase family protein [candidate division KSB1 bacterium]
MKVLFIGGTGIISSACSRLAVDKGIDLYLLNRGSTFLRPVPDKAKILQGDIRDKDSVNTILKDQKFDVVVDWVAFTPNHIETDIKLFRNKTDQYIFISSASAYQTPPLKLPVTEETPLDNPYWQYSRDKIACEELLFRTYRRTGFPVTVVRPSHTYDRTLLPNHGRWTEIDRMRKKKKVVVHGDGTSIWVLTHHRDFAVGFNGLLGNQRAIGEAFHITSDELLTWNGIFRILARAAGAEADIVNVPSAFIKAFDPDWGAGLLGDKSHSMVFDNSKIREFVPEFNPRIPFTEGAKEIIVWYLDNPERQKIDKNYNLLLDRIITAYFSAIPK